MIATGSRLVHWHISLEPLNVGIHHASWLSKCLELAYRALSAIERDKAIFGL